MFRRSILALALGWITVACMSPPSGSLTPTGYQHEEHDYGVRTTPGGDDRLMGSHWQVDNFYGERDAWMPKDGPAYLTTYTLDRDGDGEFESEVEAYVYDLRYTHREHDGVVFLRSIPLSRTQKEKRLKVLMHRFIDDIAGAGYAVVTLSGKSRVEEKRFAPLIKKEGPAKLGGLEAYAASLEIKNLDQLKVDPNAKGELVEIVIAHAPFQYVPDRYDPENKYPVLLVAGYANGYSEFSEGWGDFRNFLSRIQINGKVGAAVNYPKPESSTAKKETTNTKEKAVDGDQEEDPDESDSETAPDEEAEGAPTENPASAAPRQGPGPEKTE